MQGRDPLAEYRRVLDKTQQVRILIEFRVHFDRNVETARFGIHSHRACLFG